MTKEKAVELLYKALPYSNQIKDLDFSESGAICFTWRFSRYRLDITRYSVEEVEGGLLSGSDSSILMKELLTIKAREEELKSLVQPIQRSDEELTKRFKEINNRNPTVGSFYGGGTHPEYVYDGQKWIKTK